MLYFLPSFILGPLALFLIILNIVLITIFGMYPVSLLKRMTRDPMREARYAKWLDQIVNVWLYGNDFILFLTQKIEWDIRGQEEICDQKEWVLVVSNHRSWVDILVLFHCLHRRQPFIKFFLKQQLRKIPIMGYNWEVLDYPFLDRYSRQELEKNPDLMGQDLRRIAASCRKFNRYPVCVIAFPEGTRFSDAKQQKQNSCYSHLLKPRVGGIAVALQEMKEKLNCLLDITIYYDPTVVTFWDLLAGRVKKISVIIKRLSFPAQLAEQDYIENPSVREHYQSWLNDIWEQKQTDIEALLSEKMIDM